MAAKNPILTDTQIVTKFNSLPPEAQEALLDFSKWLYHYASDLAESNWQKRKAPMAVYWSTVKAWAFHVYRVMRVMIVP